jgi:hypothetical protein
MIVVVIHAHNATTNAQLAHRHRQLATHAQMQPLVLPLLRVPAQPNITMTGTQQYAHHAIIHALHALHIPHVLPATQENIECIHQLLHCVHAKIDTLIIIQATNNAIHAMQLVCHAQVLLYLIVLLVMLLHLEL